AHHVVEITVAETRITGEPLRTERQRDVLVGDVDVVRRPALEGAASVGDRDRVIAGRHAIKCEGAVLIGLCQPAERVEADVRIRPRAGTAGGKLGYLPGDSEEARLTHDQRVERREDIGESIVCGAGATSERL